ncbi:MAG: helix-turn-helix domain-containing protein, partial [Leadbetterella sp.]|nr:helix-turn-helix domain-containing protein [Leadbetterella sp.]
MDNLQQLSNFQFNIFRLEDLCNIRGQEIQFGRRDYYKISLIRGKKHVYYTDADYELEGSNLVFFQPDIPYTMKQTEVGQTGVFCVFSSEFFEQQIDLLQYPVYQNIQNGYVPLNSEQENSVLRIFEQMEDAFQSEYAYKYDLIRSYILQIIHTAQRLKFFGSSSFPKDAESRLAHRFSELLDAQFPIDTIAQQIKLKRPQEYAARLNVHVNYLNRVLNNQFGKSTGQLIKERIIKEARMMLRYSDWSISQISWSLGFEDDSY